MRLSEARNITATVCDVGQQGIAVARRRFIAAPSSRLSAPLPDTFSGSGAIFEALPDQGHSPEKPNLADFLFRKA